MRPPATAAAVCDRLAAALRQAAGRSVPHWSVDTVQPEGLRVRVDEGDGRSAPDPTYTRQGFGPVANTKCHFYLLSFLFRYYFVCQSKAPPACQAFCLLLLKG